MHTLLTVTLVAAGFTLVAAGPASAISVDGNDYDNVLYGTGVHDGIRGYGGNDRATGLGGDDLVLGGSGNDTLFGDHVTSHGKPLGAPGRDQIYGEDGSDTLFGNEAADYLSGGTSDDTIWAGSGDDYVYGGSGWDFLVGAEGYDRIIGNSGTDRLWGYEHGDTLVSWGDSRVRDYVHCGSGGDVALVDSNDRFIDAGGYIVSSATAGCESVTVNDG